MIPAGTGALTQQPKEAECFEILFSSYRQYSTTKLVLLILCRNWRLKRKAHRCAQWAC
jgi:hypothetical protein